MAKKYFEFDTLFSAVEQGLDERKSHITPIRFKVCSKCGEKKLIFKFSKDKRNLDGRIGVCKVCRSQESLEYYYQNKDRILTQNKEYLKANKKDRRIYFKDYQKEHKEQLKKSAGKWYKKNKKAIKKRNLKYYQENLEACQIRRKLWIENNREKIRKYNREYKRKHKILKAVIIKNG